jgi:(p)ppGpp synthase/HD superfamily hydrolase
MSLLLKNALDRAAVWHQGQWRKYPAVEVPYMSHPAGVAITLARHGFDDEVVAAGALHDVLEDTSATYEDLLREFGGRVAELVRLCSEEDKSLPWEARKQAYLDKFPQKPWEAQAITLADKIDNFQSIMVCSVHHGDPWAMFKRGREAQLSRFEALAAALPGLAPHPLIDAYRAALARLRACG